MEFLTDIGVTFWHWLIFAAVLLVLELLAPGVFFLWIAVAAGVTGLAKLLLSDLAFQYQLLIFAVFSVVVTIGGKRWFSANEVPSDHPNLNQRGMDLIGRVVTLTEDSKNGEIRLQLDGTTWRIDLGVDLAAGCKIRITSIKGTVLQAEPVQD